ncbi:MAG: oligogalacturonate lyase family protein, partial [Armatimonadota bacterium]|nr:oligogalacturonate lyase family protein [Armatimonadota bacterium]
MAVGDVIELDPQVVQDPETGAHVRRLSPNQGDTIAPYFTQSLVSADGEVLLVTSTCTGTNQVHFIDLKAAKMVQASREPGVGTHQPVLDPQRRVAYYWAGRLLRRVDLNTLRSEALYEMPDGFSGGILSLDHSGRYLAFVYQERIQTSTATGRIYSDMQEHLYRHPTCVVMRMDLQEGRAEAVWGEQNWISHVNISPTQPDLILFCHEGPWHRVHRMWVVRASTGECWPLLQRALYTEKDGHEFFTASGRVITQYSRRESTAVNVWDEFHVVIWPDGSGEERYALGRGHRATHVQAAHADETLLVGDGAFPEGQEWVQKGRHFLSLIRHTADGRGVSLPLCRHD